MGWWWFRASHSVTLSAEEQERLARKCRTLKTALEGCLKANPGESTACQNLETSLVSCYAAEYCKDEYEEHRRCFTSVVNTGQYEGSNNCQASIAAMQKGLRKYGLYPVHKQAAQH